MRAELVPAKELGPLRGNYWRLIDGDTAGEHTALPASVTDEKSALAALLAIRDEQNDPAREARMEAEAGAARQAEADAEFVARAARLGYVKHSEINSLIDARIAQRPNKT